MSSELKTQLDNIAKLCTDEASLSLAHEAIDKALADHNTRLKIFMASVSAKKIQSIVRMMNLMDDVEQRLLDPEHWSGADNHTLLRLFQVINTRIESDMNFFSKLLGGDSKIDINELVSALKHSNIEKSNDNAIPIIPLESRNRIRDSISRLIEQQVDSDGK